MLTKSVSPRCQNLGADEVGRHAVFGVPMANLLAGPSSAAKGLTLAAGTPSPSPTTVSSDSASALPSWLLVTLFALVALIIVAMFAITVYNMSAPRSTLKNLIGGRRSRRGRGRNATDPPPPPIDPNLVKTLATAARVNTRTTRTTLAIAGFSLLGVAVVAVFGLSGQGVRDLRNQVIAAVTTLVAAISGFYFGARTAEGSNGTGPASTAPGLAPDPKNPSFTVGQSGKYTPVLTGTPAPAVSYSGTLPPKLSLDPNTGVISGIPDPGTAGTHSITLTAYNGISPDAVLSVTITIT